MEQSFLPMIFRMRHIMRWGLKHNTQPENLSQHSAECAFLAHFLAVIGNTYMNKHYNADRIAAYALFHDATEILTGDLPTPVKYFNKDILSAYKSIESAAADKLLDGIPPEMRGAYEQYLKSVSQEDALLVKAADRVCAYIKCVNEVHAGNKEFETPLKQYSDKLRETAEHCAELEYFLRNFVSAFSLPLDSLGINM